MNKALPKLGVVVAALALVEVASGVIQGYYTPILTDIARHLNIHDADVNWFEAAQLMVSALSVPILSKMGDLWGHKRILLLATIVVAIASYGIALAPSFATFLFAWAVQGLYNIWLPFEVAIIYLAARRRSHPDSPAYTRKAAGILVFVLEASVIVAALLAGRLVTAIDSFELMLMVPAFAVTIVVVTIWLFVPDAPATVKGTLDWAGMAWLTACLVILTLGLTWLRTLGVASPWPWLAIVASLVLLWPFVRQELKVAEPLVDIRLLISPSMWPVQLTAGLFGVSVLGAQAPLSTFARTDAAEVGYGLSLDASSVSIIIGAYVLSLAIGALLLPLVSRLLTPRWALVVAAVLVAIGYLLFLPLHASLAQTLINMVIAGIGSGLLVAALPAAAAAAAPEDRTAMATGWTNSIKTIGGSIASAVFGVALFSGVTEAALAAGETAAPLAGYLTVWALCGGTAVICAILLAVFVPKGAFTKAAAKSVVGV